MAGRYYRKAQAACRDLEEHYGLRRVGTYRAASRYLTPAELNKATRQQRDEVPRHQLRHLVRAAADAASHESDFLDRLRRSGLPVRPRASTTNPNQLAGYAVALPDDHDAAGDAIWYVTGGPRPECVRRLSHADAVRDRVTED
jgi:phosphoserine phosphatase